MTSMASTGAAGSGAAATGAAETGTATTDVMTTVSSSTSPAPRTVTILGSGDVLLHPQLWDQAAADAADPADAAADPADAADHHTDTNETPSTAYDFGPLYASIAPDVAAADIAICELETPVGDPSGPFSGWPRFNVPPQVLSTVKDIGYDSCTTASNHTLDQGPDGVTRTLDALDDVGLAHTGSARSESEARTPLILTTDNGVTVGQLAYTFSFNGLHRPADEPWLANPIDVSEILGTAASLRQAGADIVVLSMHWGVEYRHAATATQREQAETLLASPDIDLILGSHAHVVQPMEQIHDKWVVYGMGNQVARHADPVDASREGIMPVITFTETGSGTDTFRATDAEIIPTWMQLEPDLRLIDLPRALAGGATRPGAKLTDDTRAHYDDILDRIVGYVDSAGADVPVAAME